MTEPAVGAAPLAPWVADADVTGTDASAEQVTAAIAVASEVLWALSGRRWPGAREDTLRVPAEPGEWHVPWPSSLTLFTPGRTRGCGCHSSHLDPQLPGPITAVVSLKLGDTDVPAEQIVVEDRRVVRVKPGADATTDPLAVNLWVDDEGFYALWPSGACSCGRAAGAELTVQWGTPPPEAGAAAAQQLATEIAKGLSGGNCRIAGNVTSVNRQGVSVLLDPTTFLDKGRTGVPLVDLWLQAVNPNKLQRPPEVWFPEADAPVRLA